MGGKGNQGRVFSFPLRRRYLSQRLCSLPTVAYARCARAAVQPAAPSRAVRCADPQEPLCVRAQRTGASTVRLQVVGENLSRVVLPLGFSRRPCSCRDPEALPTGGGLPLGFSRSRPLLLPTSGILCRVPKLCLPLNLSFSITTSYCNAANASALMLLNVLIYCQEIFVKKLPFRWV